MGMLSDRIHKINKEILDLEIKWDKADSSNNVIQLYIITIQLLDKKETLKWCMKLREEII